jgi:hypothetical protein
VTGQTDERLILFVAHVIDTLTERITAGLLKQRLQPTPILRFQHLPAIFSEQPLQSRRPNARHNPVEALAVQINDPDQVVQTFHRLIEDRLPHIALVQFCIAHQRNKASRCDVSEMEFRVAMRQCRKCRRNRTQPNRTGRKIDIVRVFRATGIRLETAVGAECGEIAAGQSSKQILDGMKRWRCVRGN